MAENLDLNQQIQAYGNGPQFLGFLLHNSEDLAPQWGDTTLSAALSPIPVFGEVPSVERGEHLQPMDLWTLGGGFLRR